METVAFCEIEKFPRKVLAKHWPNIPIYEDVRNVTKEQLEADGITGVDVVTGGFPCQDISVAGKQKGITAERSGLWSELCRIISEVRPKYAIVENVTALITGESGGWFHTVLGDLAEIGYNCEWHCISASELGANHHRDRIWIICYPQHARRNASKIRESNQTRNGSDPEGQKSTVKSAGPSDANNMENADSQRLEKLNNAPEPDKQKQFGGGDNENNLPNPNMQRQEQTKKTHNNGSDRQKPSDKLTRRLRELLGESKINSGGFTPFGLLDSVEPTICRDTYGLPYRVDRIKGLGNAVVPMIPELIGKAIMSLENKELQ